MATRRAPRWSWILGLLLVCGPAFGTVHNDPEKGWYGLGYEDVLLLNAVGTNPKLRTELNADKSRVDRMPPGPAKDAAGARFHAKWMGEIAKFSQSYEPGHEVPGLKPSVEELRQRIPWLSQIDQSGPWKGGIFEQLIAKLDAPEAGLIAARMQSLNNRPNDRTRANLEKKLAPFTLARLAGADTIADKMIGDASDPETVRGYMAQLQKEALERAPETIAEAQKAAATADAEAAKLAAAQPDANAPQVAANDTAPAAATLVDKVSGAKEQAEKLAGDSRSASGVFDGAKTDPAGAEAGAVHVPAGQGAPDTGKRQLQAPPSGQTTDADALAGAPPPAPDTSGGEQEKAPGPKLRPSMGDVAGSMPLVLGTVGGALLGAGIGLLLGGPIGALIGGAIGLMLGAGGAFGFLTK